MLNKVQSVPSGKSAFGGTEKDYEEFKMAIVALLLGTVFVLTILAAIAQ